MESRPMKDASVELIVRGTTPSYFEYVPAGTSAAKVLEHCGRRVGYGGGGYLTHNGYAVDLDHKFVSDEIYTYHMSIEQQDKRRALTTFLESSESLLAAASLEESILLANSRAAILDERTSELKRKRAEQMSDLNRQWRILHEATKPL